MSEEAYNDESSLINEKKSFNKVISHHKSTASQSKSKSILLQQKYLMFHLIIEKFYSLKLMKSIAFHRIRQLKLLEYKKNEMLTRFFIGFIYQAEYQKLS
jgi:hypothetical protein